MDDLSNALASSFSVSTTPNNPYAPHPRFSMYKNTAARTDQDERRRRILEHQKNKRDELIRHARNLADDKWEDVDEGEEGMECETAIHRPGRRYRNQLMLSEWLVEVPDDFETEWLMVLCPVGKRSLVVASNGKTAAYSKSGYRIRSFPSSLPGGSRKQGRGNRDFTIFDCIYSETSKIYYILDLLSWKDYTLYDSETEFRFFWMHGKLQEIPEVGEVKPANPNRFIPLPSFACTKDSIGSAIAAAPFEIDGLLFYHKRTHYTFGPTPLVVWLKPYMVPEILGVSVPEPLMAAMPETYSTYAKHMEDVAKDKREAAQKREQRKHKNSPGKNDSKVEASHGSNSSSGSHGSGMKKDLKADNGASMDITSEPVSAVSETGDANSGAPSGVDFCKDNKNDMGDNQQ